jgi:hypothetical protein
MTVPPYNRKETIMSYVLCPILMCQATEGEEGEPSQGGQEAGSRGQTASGY